MHPSMRRYVHAHTYQKPEPGAAPPAVTAEAGKGGEGGEKKKEKKGKEGGEKQPGMYSYT